ncbi:unnamed protein product [Protopolystoma xenopodis]|uniref:Uncharacterized protein n=1 Tax=Protopolystoma xenopodis TaxID=117903 RepID=A0A448X9W6_9PLAT|nr:unnamed protein product [Protopolystoma xenopodis]
MVTNRHPEPMKADSCIVAKDTTATAETSATIPPGDITKLLDISPLPQDFNTSSYSATDYEEKENIENGKSSWNSTCASV